MSPKIRQSIYGIGVLATGLLSLLSVWKVIDPTTASTINASVSGLLSLLGAGAAGTAAVVLGKQRKEGTLDFQGSAADQAVAAIQATVAAATESASELQKVKDAVGGVIRDIPVLGPIGAQIFNDIIK